MEINSAPRRINMAALLKNIKTKSKTALMVVLLKIAKTAENMIMAEKR